MKFKLGSCYAVEFNDHTMGGLSAMRCSAVGWVYSQDDTIVTLAYWVPLGGDEEEKIRNMECLNILKSTIIKKRKLT
jgi:hypothetical protein